VSTVTRRLVAAYRLTIEPLVARVPRPARTSGGWMVAWGDATGRAIRERRFEPDETAFVRRFLRPGMKVADVGAHGGFYTLLARAQVGSAGQVVAFEPSPRELRRLRTNLRLNRIDDVAVVSTALGEREGETEYYVVHGVETGFGGRRAPDVRGRIEQLTVGLTTLDAALARLGVGALDLVKVDVEGGELDVFRGAISTLTARPRPLVLCEISDARSAAWGHEGGEVHAFLAELGFDWYEFARDGSLVARDGGGAFHGNFVAVPSERRDAVREVLRGG